MFGQNVKSSNDFFTVNNPYQDFGNILNDLFAVYQHFERKVLKVCFNEKYYKSVLTVKECLNRKKNKLFGIAK